MMDITKCIAALFDFDGVVVDTESQYSIFWNQQGELYHPELEEFGRRIKGQTLGQIFDGYFAGETEVQKKITADLNEFEKNMQFDFLPGVVDFMKELRANGIKIAIVTSSNDLKMANVYKAHPELTSMVDRILTADMFTQSKPHPECFLLGAKIFDTVPDNCVVFEDSFHGLEAARRANMKIVGLCTTNPREAIKDKADVIIGDFVGFNVEQVKDLLK
jgi:HAD superfamily hydrolase (TIGR01509 family)